MTSIKNLLQGCLPSPIWKSAAHLMRKTHFVTELMPREREAAWYDNVYRTTPVYDCAYYDSHYYFLWCVVVDRIMGSGIRSVLDIGCGPGQVASFLHDRGLEAYHGVDLSSVAIEKARGLCPYYTFATQNVLDTHGFGRIEYEAAISMEVLEHVNDDDLMLQKIRKGARFIGTVPDFPYPSHVRYFKNQEEVLGRYGGFFQHLSVQTFTAPGGKQKYFLMDGIV